MNSYRNRQFGLKLKPSNRVGFWLVSCLPWLSHSLINEVRSLPSPLPGQRLLDVGCGNGRFLSLAKSMGWDVFGVDFDPEAVDAANQLGLNVVCGDVFSVKDYGGFDYITCSHVIEHVHDPKAVLSHLYALLKPYGCLWIETPNIDSYGHQQFKESWRGLEPPRHLVLFNHDALITLLGQVGFSQIHSPAINIFQVPFIYSASQRVLNHQEAKSANFFHGISLKTLWIMIKASLNVKRREFLTLVAKK